MFALTGLDNETFSVNLKCNPEWAVELRQEYKEIQSGYHMSKKHWNTVSFEGRLSEELLKKLIDHSYDLVIKGLSKKTQKKLGF